jgi:uroporphyrinogen decarboxylase
MTSQERIQIVLSGGVPDRVPFQDSYWATTIQRWRREGLPTNVSLDEYFGCEIARIGGDYSLQFPVQTIEETDQYRVYIDDNGATRKVLHTADGWTPYWLDFTIKSRDDWYRFRAHGTYNSSRISKGIVDAYRWARENGKFITYSVHACFHPTWHKIGMENMMVWMHEDPDFITDMFATHTQLVIDLYEGIKALGVQYDAAWFSDDLGYLVAPLISPDMYRELVMPHHKRLCDHFAKDGLKTFLHSDGNVGPLIPDFLRAGFAALHPLEAKAGLDVRELKPKYGERLVLFGNIDVRQLASNREAIEEEIRAKFTAAKPGGGYIYHSDHSVPNDVSLENYRFAVEMIQKYGRYE